ncbi:hypothetical protein N9C31_00015 [Gammaproteobacteria bacterium]|nr:hypothetical protein [Gammaproteobacteria bacterium]
MTINQRLFSAISMIAGTSIGAAMVAMPVYMASLGTVACFFVLLISYLAMLAASFFMLESNLSHEPGSNLVSMSTSALGRSGYWLCVTIYLMLLYCLNAAYLSELSEAMVASFDIPGHQVFALFFSVAVLYFIVPFAWAGRIASYLLWGLMVTYGLIIGLLSIKIDLYTHPSIWSQAPGALFICILAFGYQIIIPSLRRFLKNDVRLLKKAIYIGSSIPFFVYLIWMMVFMLNMPSEGPFSLSTIVGNSSIREQLPHLLASKTGISQLPALFNAFILFAIGSSLIGVSISLFDFIKDWLKQVNQSQVLISVIAFSPPVLSVLFYPKLFMMALRPAGTLVSILLMILPVLNCFFLRVQGKTGSYRIKYFKTLAAFVLFSAIFTILWDLKQFFGQ